MKKIKILFTAILFLFSLTYGQQILHKGNIDYLSNTLVIKVNQNIVGSSSDLNKSLSKFSVKNAQEIFPSKNILLKGESILAGIYFTEYSNNEDPFDLAKKVSRLPGIVWAEPKYIRHLTYMPNDSIYNSSINAQASLKQVSADQAWNITKGAKNVIIGIVDTGVDWGHPDLAANIYKVNGSLVPGSDLGGLDGTPDNDPSEDIIPGGQYHGTHVAGIASGVTDNNIGIASIGFNCSILPVKVSRSDQRNDFNVPLVYYGFEGIKFAADNGAKVISCSWGGPAFSSYEQSIIDYAIHKGAVVVAAQGNEGLTDPFYPADYKGVLSVGWLDTGIGVNTINWSANYGEYVKVFAPGTSIISTWQRNTGTNLIYQRISGSSMAAPLVSGLAGLVWTQFPDYTPLQIEEQIRVTADNIDELNGNGIEYNYLLGRGKINAINAVTKTNTISLRADTIKFVEIGNGDGIYEADEEVGIDIKFKNYLSPVNNVNVTLYTTDKYVSIESGSSSFDTGPLSTLDTVSNLNKRFIFKINSNVPYNHDVHLRLQFSGTDYDDFQWIDVRVNPTYRTHDNNNIAMTVTSTDNLAYDDYPNNSEGHGFKYKSGENLMFEGAFMYGISPTQVMNNARELESQKQDFVYNTPISITTSANQQYGYCIFSDSGSTKLGVQTILSTYSYSQEPDNNYIILKSSLHNTTSSDINGLYAGYFIDWDIPESGYSGDTTYFDQQSNIAIAYNVKNSLDPYTGVALISQSNGYGYYGLDNSAAAGSVAMNDGNGLTDAEKWYALHSGISKQSAGVGDISIFVSGGPYTILSDKSVDVAFAIAAGETLNEVIAAIQQSRIKYQTIVKSNEKPAEYKLNQNYPNPFNPSTIIEYTIPEAGIQNTVHVLLKVYDLLGRQVATLVNENQKPGNYNYQFSILNSQLPSGVYFYRLTAGEFSMTKKMILLK